MITNDKAREQYSGNGRSTDFPVPFLFHAPDHVRAVLRQPNGDAYVDTELVLDTDYMLTGVGNEAGGEMTYPKIGSGHSVLAAGEVLTVYRQVPYTQKKEISNTDTLDLEEIENGLDQVVMQTQQLASAIDRCPKYPVATADEDMGNVDDYLNEVVTARNEAVSAVGDAEDAQAAAETARDEAQAAQAALSLPDIDLAEVGDLLRVNDGKTGYEYASPAEIGADEVKNLLVAEAMRRAVGDAEDGREYLGDGWMDPLADADEVDAENSSGYEFQSADTGYLQPIPAAEGVDKTLDYALEADYGQEDVKGSISTLTVDTENASGHFDAAANAKVLAGCRMVIDGTSYTITAITNDGTGNNEVEFDGALTTGAKTVTAVYGTVFDSGLAKLNQYTGSQTMIDRTAGTATGDMTSQGGLAAAFDGVTSQTNGNSATKLSVTVCYIGKDWGAGVTKNVSGFKAYGSSDSGFKEASDPTITITLQGSNNATDWTDLGNATATDANSLCISKLTGLTPGNYRYHRLKIQCSDSANHMYCAEAQFFETPQAAPTNQFYTVTGTIAAAGITDINSAAVTETANGQSVLFAFSFDDGVTFKAWDGDSWETVSAPTSDGAGWMTPATVEGVADADWPTPTGDIKVAVALKTTSAGQNPEVDSVVLSVDTETTNAVIQFTGFTAEVPDLAKVVLVFEAVDDVVLDTDLAAFVRRGEGEFIQADLEMDSRYDADKVLVAGDIDLSAGSGTGTVLKLTTHNNKRLKVYAASCTFKEA